MKIISYLIFAMLLLAACAETNEETDNQGNNPEVKTSAWDESLLSFFAPDSGEITIGPRYDFETGKEITGKYAEEFKANDTLLYGKDVFGLKRCELNDSLAVFFVTTWHDPDTTFVILFTMKKPGVIVDHVLFAGFDYTSTDLSGEYEEWEYTGTLMGQTFTVVQEWIYPHEETNEETGEVMGFESTDRKEKYYEIHADGSIHEVELKYD